MALSSLKLVYFSYCFKILWALIFGFMDRYNVIIDLIDFNIMLFSLLCLLWENHWNILFYIDIVLKPELNQQTNIY